MIESMFVRAYDFALRHSIATLVLTALVFGLALNSMRHLAIELDIYGKEIQGFPSTKDLQEQRNRYGDANSVILLFSKNDGQARFTQGEVCRLKSWIETEQNQNVALRGVASPFSLRQAREEEDKLWYRPLLDLDCEDKNKAAQSFGFEGLKDSPWRNVITDHSFSDLGAEFLFQDTKDGSRFGRFDPKPVLELHEKVERDLKNAIPDLKIYMVGASAVQAHLREALAHDFALQGLFFVIVLVAFRWMFGTWLSGIVFVSTNLINVVLTYGLMAAVGHPLDLLTNNLALMESIAGIEDFLFIAMLMRSRGVGIEQAMRTMITPCFFTTLTTVIGFVSLKTSDVDIIGRFGMWSAWAAFVEWIGMFLIFPALCRHLPVLGRWVDPKRASRAGWFEKLAEISAPRSAIYVSGVLFVAGLAAFSYLNINDNPTHNFSSNHINTKSFEYLEKSRGWSVALPIVFESDDIARDQQKIESTLEQIRQEPNIVSILNPFDVPRYAAAQLKEENRGLVANDIQATPSYKRLFSAHDQARAIIYVKNGDLESQRVFSERLQQLCPNNFCRVAGQGAVYLEFSQKIIPTLLNSFLLSLILVVITLVLIARRFGIPHKFAIAYSAVWGPIAMMVLIAAFKIPVSVVTSLFAAVMVGIAGDNAIQFMFASKNGDLKSGIDERDDGSVFLCLLLAAGSLVFFAQSIKPIQLLGLLFLIGFLVNLAGDLWLLKGVLPANDRESKTDNQSQNTK